MGSKGPGQQAIDTQNQITQGQLSVEQSANKRSQQLYDLTEPGMKTAESFYQQLASGNPQAIQTATAPATEKIASSYNQAITNIGQNMPRGGAKDLAVQEAEISKAGAIGGTEAQAYLGAPTALANLAQGGIGLSVNEMTQALSAFSGASSSNQAAGQMQGAGKAETLGFLGSLGQSAATGAGMAIGCWIAAAIFGENDLRTVRLRVFLNQVWAKESRLGHVVMFAYLRYGQFVAREVAKRDWLRRIFTPLFNYADSCARKWEVRAITNLRLASVA